MLEANVHFPTAVNLLWDAQRKCADLRVPMAVAAQLAGWRKGQDWRRRLKGQMIRLTRLTRGGGPNQEQRQRKGLVEHLPHPGQFALVEDIRRVHRDLQVR